MNRFITVLTLTLLVFNVNSQTTEDFIIIDEITENFDFIENQLAGQSNVYITKGESITELKQISKQLENRTVKNLHIYATSKPGILIFNHNQINIRNIDTYKKELSSWNKYISGKVIFHTSNIFTGLDGILLKHKLESITGLIFNAK